MVCALTVRKLKPGSFDQFLEQFAPPSDQDAPPGWKGFYALRNADDPDEVITFGLFDGTAEDLRGMQDDRGYSERRAKIDELVESVGADSVYEVVEHREPS